QTSILNRRILEREPQTHNVVWFRVEKRAVLMTRNLAADIRLLEDIHRLNEIRVVKSDGLGHLFDLFTPREAIEDRIEIVQRVTYLVDRLFFPILQRPIRVESILLKEETNLVSGGHEVVVSQSILLAR